MKKILVLICCFLFLLSLCSCKAKKDELKEPVGFYYLNSQITYNSTNGVLTNELQEGAGFHNNLSAFLHAYLRGPISDKLEGLIPSDVYLVSCEIEDNTANIVFSSQFSSLSGLNLSTACSALLLTVHDYTGVDGICIWAKGSEIDGKECIYLSMDDIVLNDFAEVIE